jgi:hypothetical protein
MSTLRLHIVFQNPIGVESLHSGTPRDQHA